MGIGHAGHSPDPDRGLATGGERSSRGSILTQEGEERLNELAAFFDLGTGELQAGGAQEKVVKAAVIRDVLEGELPTRFEVEGVIPFNLQKTEQIVWVFQNVRYIETRIKRHYVGGRTPE